MNKLDRTKQLQTSIMMLAVACFLNAWGLFSLDDQSRDFQERISALEQTQCFNEQTIEPVSE